MASTVVMEKDGLLVNSKGVNGESGRMKKLASRMLGGNSSKATLNYGWNGADELEISKGGQEGEKITLNAATTVVTGDLLVGNESIFDLLDQASAAALAGINGVPGEIKVYSDSSDEAFMIGLDPEFLRKIDDMDDEIDDLIAASGGYSIGDGLSLSDPGNTLSVNIGQGLKFQSAPNQSGRQVVLDMDSAPTQGSVKPVTSGGIYDAIQQGGGGGVWGSISGNIDSQSDLKSRLDSKANSSNVYSRSTIDSLLGEKADQDTTYTKMEVDTAVNAKIGKSASNLVTTSFKLQYNGEFGLTDILSFDDETGWMVNAYSNYAYYAGEAEDAKSLINPIADVKLSMNQEGKLYLMSHNGDVVDEVAKVSHLPYAKSSTVGTRKVMVTDLIPPDPVTLPAIPNTNEILNCDIVVNGKAATTDFSLEINSADSTNHPVHYPNGEGVTCKKASVTMVSCVGINGIGWLVVGCTNFTVPVVNTNA